MATGDGPKYVGPVVLDLLALAIPANGNAANIPPQLYQRFLKDTADIALLRKHRVEISNILKICEETLARKVNNREDDISIMAKAAGRHRRARAAGRRPPHRHRHASPSSRRSLPPSAPSAPAPCSDTRAQPAARAAATAARGCTTPQP